MNKKSHNIHSITLNEEIKIKGKRIISMSRFSSNQINVPVFKRDSDIVPEFYATGRIELDNIEVCIDFKKKKTKKLLELLKGQERISFTVNYSNDRQVLSTGYIIELSSSEDNQELSFTYMPNEFRIL